MKLTITVSLCLIISIALSQNIKLSANHSAKLLELENNFYRASTDSEKYVNIYSKFELLVDAEQYILANKELNRLQKMPYSTLLQMQFTANASAHCFAKNWYSACLQILEADTSVKNILEYSFTKTLCYNEQENFDDIKTEIRHINKRIQNDTTQLFSQLKTIKEKTKTKYMILQALLPGLGMYSLGYKKKGVISFLLNSMFASIAVSAINAKLYGVAFVFGVFPFGKFYTGGLRHVKYLVEKNNEKSRCETKQHNAALLYQYYIK